MKDTLDDQNQRRRLAANANDEALEDNQIKDS